jgi:hypothetical protein
VLDRVGVDPPHSEKPYPRRTTPTDRFGVVDDHLVRARIRVVNERYDRSLNAARTPTRDVPTPLDRQRASTLPFGGCTVEINLVSTRCFTRRLVLTKQLLSTGRQQLSN